MTNDEKMFDHLTEIIKKNPWERTGSETELLHALEVLVTHMVMLDEGSSV